MLLPCVAQADIEPSAPDPDKPISFSADQANRWTDGDFEVWWLRGHIEVTQENVTAIGDEAILWLKRDGDLQQRVTRLTSYIEGEVTVSQGERPKPGERPANGIQDRRWIYTFYSSMAPQIKIATPGAEPAKKPPILDRALALRGQKSDELIRQAQYLAPSDPVFAAPPQAGPPPNSLPPDGAVRLPPITNPAPPSAVVDPNLPPGALPPGAIVVPPAPPPSTDAPRKLDFYSRSNVPYQFDILPTPGTNETVVTLRNGVRMIVDNVAGQGTLDLSADSIVVWTTGLTSLMTSTLQAQDVPLEIYMEGNIAFRQGNRKIYASRMYYNVQQQVGVILNTEIISDAPKFAGKVRLRADVVQQTGPGQFMAKHAFVTSSRLAKPGYRMQAGTMEYVDKQAAAVDPISGQPRPPIPGVSDIESDRLLTSRNNLAFIGPVPVFYWPVFKSDLEESSFFIRRASYKSDRIFGQQVYVTWDPYQILGIKRLPGNDWSISTDYFSKRGPAVGTAYRWQGPDFFGLQGPVRGFADAWVIHDTGLDTLGSDRVNLAVEPPGKDPRGRALGRHRQYLPGGFVVSGQIGWISDRNFLEQYFENEWDKNKDYDTELELKRYRDNTSWSVFGSVRLNDWFTQTQWLPRGDHFWIGQPLLGDRLTWFEHSSAAYANMRIAAQPTDPSEIAKFAYLPWENNVKGGRYFTTQEIDLPFSAGGVNFVPYGLGQLAHWDQDLSGNQLNRAYGQVGMRASIPFWATNPTYESTLFNVHGLAHKVLFEADANWSDTNQDMTQLPLYDPIDDDNLEAFNRRFQFNTFGSPPPVNSQTTPIPAKWDPRYYAIRSGLGSSVTSSSPELLQSLTAIRLNMRQRWQTKRGLPQARHIIDWITFDTGVSIFPQADRDNFGQVFGLANYNFNWHVGDRVTLLSDGIFDFFQGGQKLVTVGAFLNRPPRGSLYVGFHSLNGPVVPGVLTPFNNQVLIGTYSYRMSPKWVSAAGLSYNLAGKNIGENLTLTRIGESFLVSMGVNADVSKNNFGFTFMIEPRFMPRTMLGRVGGAQIPLAGQNGLE